MKKLDISELQLWGGGKPALGKSFSPIETFPLIINHFTHCDIFYFLFNMKYYFGVLVPENLNQCINNQFNTFDLSGREM